jgi:hypothetical protein
MRFQNPITNSAKIHCHESVREDWLYRLAAGIIGGGANAVIGGVTINAIDPIRFNAQNLEFYKLALAMFLTGAVMSIFMALKQTPSSTTTRLPMGAQSEPWPPGDRRGRQLRLVSGSKRT